MSASITHISKTAWILSTPNTQIKKTWHSGRQHVADAFAHMSLTGNYQSPQEVKEAVQNYL